MIDTVCLLVPKNSITFLRGVPGWDLYAKTDQYQKFVRNPSKREKDTGRYFPRLTGYSRRYSQEANVRIEFSVPKLVYLNNLDEVSDADFELVVVTLQKRLEEMGVSLTEYVIENASVSAVHFSKNILLEDGFTASYLISEINKIDLQKTFDFTKTRFINNGQGLYFHATTHQFVIYDKMADLNKAKKRAIDKDQTIYQRSLFESLGGKQNRTEVIRFEARISRKQKMNKLIESLGYEKNPTFKDVFSREMSKKVLLDYWSRGIKLKNIGLFSLSLSQKDALQAIFLSDEAVKPKQAIYLLGLYLLAKDEAGIRQFRSIVTKRMHERSWYRMANDIRYANELITKNNLRGWVKQLDDALQVFEAYRANQHPP